VSDLGKGKMRISFEKNASEDEGKTRERARMEKGGKPSGEGRVSAETI